MDLRCSAVGRSLATVGFLAIVTLFAAPAEPAAAAPGESIGNYDTRLEVLADGRLRVAEQIEYDFGANNRHGIFRKVPTTLTYDGKRDRLYPIDDVNATLDGHGVPVDRYPDGSYTTLKIGDPDRTLSGRHTYLVEYTVRGALNRFDDHDELYWNAIGNEWPVPIGRGRVEVTGPAAIQRVACYTGPAGSRNACASASANGASASFSQPSLAAGSAITIVVALPAGSVAGTDPILVDRHEPFRVTRWTVGGAILVALLAVAAALAIAWRTGRDRRYVGLLPGLVPGYGEHAAEERKPLFDPTPVSVEFGPPDGLRPGQVGTLVDERAHVVDVTATIVDFAVRKHLHIRQLPLAEKNDWELTKLPQQDRGFLHYEWTLFNALFADGDKVRLSELKHNFAGHLAKVRSQLYDDMVEQGWYRRSPARTRTVARLVAFGILVLSVFATGLLAMFTNAALIGVGLIAGAIVLLAGAGRFPARTGRGSAALARLQGLRLYIANAEAEQLRFQEREQIFSTFLPYAIVFGLTAHWATVFRQLAASAPDGTTASTLYWFTGPAWYHDDEFATSLDDFTATAGNAISVSPPSASGSSGFSSSGFSGGGGGGGGGGSW